MRIIPAILALLVTVASCSDSTSPPGLPAELQLVSGAAAITAHVGDTLAPIVVQMRDANGRAVPGVPVVAWGTVGPVPVGRTDYGVTPLDSVVFTDRSGRASIRMVAPTVAGTGVITVQIGNVPTDQSTTHAMGATIPITTTAAPFTQLVAHRMQRFAGATFSIDSLFTPADSYGNPVSASSVTATATNGWSVSGKTLTPPSASYVGMTVVTATSGSVSASDTVAVVDDMRKYHWTFQYKCAGTPAEVAAGAADSVIAYGTNGTAYYPGDPGYQPIMVSANVTQPVLEFRFTGNLTSYRNGVATVGADIMAGNPYGWDVYSQSPDAVVFGVDSYARTLTRVPATLPSFASPTAWCSGTTLQGVTLQAY